MRKDTRDWKYWWAVFVGRPAQFIYAEGENAAWGAAQKIDAVRTLKTLPYPTGTGPAPDGMPAFCYKPAECAGKTSCPRSYACSE